MTKWCLILALLLPTAAAAAGDLRPVINREVVKCATAWMREDCSAIVSYLPPRMVQQSGGRAASVSELKEQFAQARRLGAQQLEAVPGPASTPTPIGHWLVAFVPVTAVVHGAHVDLSQETHVLALSSDRGKRWSFLLLYGTSQADLNAWYPEFRGRVRVPPDAKPQLSLAY